MRRRRRRRRRWRSPQGSENEVSSYSDPALLPASGCECSPGVSITTAHRSTFEELLLERALLETMARDSSQGDSGLGYQNQLVGKGARFRKMIQTTTNTSYSFIMVHDNTIVLEVSSAVYEMMHCSFRAPSFVVYASRSRQSRFSKYWPFLIAVRKSGGSESTRTATPLCRVYSGFELPLKEPYQPYFERGADNQKRSKIQDSKMVYLRGCK